MMRDCCWMRILIWYVTCDFFGLNLMSVLLFLVFLKEDFMKTRKEKAKQGRKGSKKGKLGF